MKEKTIFGLIAALVMVLIIIFAGCIGQNGEKEESGGKVKGVPLSVEIQKDFIHETILGNLEIEELHVDIIITNTGTEDIDLSQFEYELYEYDPTYKAYQENLLFIRTPTLGPSASHEIGPLETMLFYSDRPKNEEEYKFIIKKRPENWNEEIKKVFEISFSVSPEDWDELYR